jgi:hypothetical protein
MTWLQNNKCLYTVKLMKNYHPGLTKFLLSRIICSDFIIRGISSTVPKTSVGVPTSFHAIHIVLKIFPRSQNFSNSNHFRLSIWMMSLDQILPSLVITLCGLSKQVRWAHLFIVYIIVLSKFCRVHIPTGLMLISFIE